LRKRRRRNRSLPLASKGKKAFYESARIVYTVPRLSSGAERGSHPFRTRTGHRSQERRGAGSEDWLSLILGQGSANKVAHQPQKKPTKKKKNKKQKKPPKENQRRGLKAGSISKR